jgi:hypothetical protein
MFFNIIIGSINNILYYFFKYSKSYDLIVNNYQDIKNDLIKLKNKYIYK